MNNEKVNYNQIHSSYDKRYKTNQWENFRDGLTKLLASNSCKKILEVGCGTGYWLEQIDDPELNIFGIDYSKGMLDEASAKNRCRNLINADANNLPIKKNYFDLIFCVNALHHFTDKKKFIIDCKEYLAPGGTSAIICVDPRCEEDDWYLYSYFDSVYEDDLSRFPSWNNIEKWMAEAGFKNVQSRIVDNVNNDKIGSEIFSDPWLAKGGTSQLAKLSDEDYESGINKIKAEIELNEETLFKVRITFKIIWGVK